MKKYVKSCCIHVDTVWSRAGKRCLYFFLLVSFFLLPDWSFASETFELRPFHRQMSLVGFTRPKKELIVSSEVSGRCKNVLVDLGDSVDFDGVVVELDKTFVMLDLQKNRIAQERAERQLEMDKKTVARFTTLIKNKSAAQATFDEAAFQADSHAIGMKSLKNEAVRLKELLKRYTLVAPSGWKVIQRSVEPGEFVRPGEPLLRLGDFRQLLVPFVLTCNQLETLEKMGNFELFFPDRGETVAGKVWRVAPGFDEITRKIGVDVLVDVGPHSVGKRWRGGMRAVLKLRRTEEKNSFSVPSSALLSRYEAHWLVNDKGQQMKVILLEMSEDKTNAVVAGIGLSAGRNFLLHPQQSSVEQQ